MKTVFERGKIKAVVTTVGENEVLIDDEMEKFGYDEKSLKRLKKSAKLHSRYLAKDGVCASDLCVNSAEYLFDNYDIKREDIDGLIFVTQSPDYKMPSTAIIMQDRLKLPISTIAFDVNLGCSGFVYGLYMAHSFINSGAKNILVALGDVNRCFCGEKDKIITPLMGDAGSVVLVSNEENRSYFSLYSDGSGYKNLIVPAGGCRKPSTEETKKAFLREDGGIRSDEDLYMNGREIFNFAIKRVPSLIEEILEFSKTDKSDIDYFLLHQANAYILQTIQKKLGVDAGKVPSKSVEIYGNQNSASISGIINGFLYDEFSTKKLDIICAGFGIGLSWGGFKTTVENVFAPEILKGVKND
ncbi:MAG: 3-oxoacyl-[acyl-carrier-protein] synthase III C-terminal domain-containing protein [Nautiliaceae bacterium]